MVEKVIRKPEEYRDPSELQDVLGVMIVAEDLDDVNKITMSMKSGHQVTFENDYIASHQKATAKTR